MGTIAEKLTYLNTTKTMLRDSLNKFGSNILTTDTFRSYDTKLNDIYDKLPKVTATGQGLTIYDVQNGLLDDFKMNGVDLEQNTTETITINEWEQGDINSDGSLASSNSAIRTTNYIKIFPNILYNISRTISTSYMKFRFYDNNKSYLGTQADINITTNKQNNQMISNQDSMELTINDTTVSYMKIVDISNNLNTIYTITTNNTPSPSYPQEIKVVEGRQVITDKGKNLLKLYTNNSSITINDVECSIDNNDTITLNGTASQTTYIEILSNFVGVTSRSSTKYISLDELKIYTLKSFILSGTYTNAPKLNTQYDNQYSEKGEIFGNSISISNSDGLYRAWLRIENGTVLDNLKINIQLEENSSATDYEPYYNPVSYNIDLNLENIYLAKMPNTTYKNRIYKNNGNWYFEEKAKKVVLDGSETITIQNIGTDNWYYQLSVNCYKTEQLKQMCSHYKNSGIYNSNTYEGIMMLTDGDFIRIRYGEEDTVANFKAWLSNNNVELWYPLINSITTQITNTTLINQLEAISVHTGTNIITISNSNNIIPEIEITRLKELEKLS